MVELEISNFSETWERSIIKTIEDLERECGEAT